MPEPIQIEKDKTYVIEIDHIVSEKHVRSVIKTFKESTGSNAIVLHGARLARVASEAEEAIERVRELHKPIEEVNENGFVNIVCNGCFDEEPSTGQEFHHDYPCPTIKALDGEQ
jgi:hypothetical protein